MKKILALVLAAMLVLSVAACGGKDEEKPDTPETEIQQTEENKEDGKDTEKEESKEEAPKQDNDKEASSQKKPSTNSQTTKPEAQKPAAKPEENKPAAKPEAEKPAEKPEENKPVTKPEADKPAEKPVEKPEEIKPSEKLSVGNTLLADFKAKAASSSSAVSIAEGLLANSVIAFSGAAMPVEPGYLTGFGNNEIKGFKEGAMFAPMIGTIPFVGYVFVLENASDVPAFISTLKASADLRWNICTTADEMISGSVGNKVFFVMCPTSFEEE
ncbi:MAG: hypothetical protein E7412_06750 [Ruminococcaceae bacterium]|nr:hypothetical protein [Oscillospiraceae bacterium]